MPYKLAKQLKDAGFSQKSDGIVILPEPQSGRGIRLVGGSENEIVYAPTLEEIIEECGGRFKMLRNFDNKFDAVGGKDSEFIFTELYDTALIAVANLWLALNKK